MGLRLFMTVKETLDQLYPNLPNKKDTLVQRRLELLREYYKGLNNGNIPDYSDSITRYAYLYGYVAFHANVVCKLLERNSQKFAQTFNKGEVNIACIGGGPGSDLLGILKHISQSCQTDLLRIQIYDRQDLWKDVLKNLKLIYENESDFSNLGVKWGMRTLDVTNPTERERYPNLREADLFTFSFFLSELYPMDSIDAENFFKILFEQAKSGATFLFVDNVSSGVQIWFDNLIGEYNQTKRNQDHIEIIDQPRNRQDKEEFCMDTSERLDHLSSHYGRYCDINGSPSCPRLKASVVFRICRKG